MKNHNCVVDELRTLNSRKFHDYVRRRKECMICKRRMTTYEYVTEEPDDKD